MKIKFVVGSTEVSQGWCWDNTNMLLDCKEFYPEVEAAIAVIGERLDPQPKEK